MNKVDVLLLEDISSLGLAGDIVAVAEGYARNSLFPAGKAALADAKARSASAARQAAAAEQAAAEREALQAKAGQLDGTELTIAARVKDGLDIFGRITAREIAKQLAEQASMEIKAKDITLPEPITKIGEYDITVSVGPDSEAIIKLVVAAAAGEQADE